VEARILVVDDEEGIRDFLSKALPRMGRFTVELASSAEEALKKIEQGDFDLVLTDLKMPNTDGLKLVDEITKSKPEVLTVLMTGYGTIDSVLEAMKRGASDYLTKPFNLEEMAVRIQKVLEQRQRFVKLRDFAIQLERANQELRKIDEMKSEFISVASHELRTPLAAIKNAVHLILNRKTGEINDTQAKFLSMAERNINRLTNILDDLLDLSRIESGKIEMKIEELDLKGPIEFILSTLKPQADGKSIQLQMGVPQELPLVYGDRGHIEQILMNLVGNALKFTPEGGQVSVWAKPWNGEGDLVAISVQDSGIGVPQDQLEKVFEKFYQVESSLNRSVSGTGLGLAITRGLVQAHKGKIWAESEVGRGSTFTFTLPISKGERREPQFRTLLDREFRRAQENSFPLTLFLIEILELKAELKDALLEQVEEKVRECLRREGDILLMREKERVWAAICGTGLQGAQVIRQRIEEEFQNLFLKGWDRPAVVKVGTATYPEEASSQRELFMKAKEKLGG
jgi:signal transduction histidine kinase/GGDEF domain-containing protein